MGTAKLNLLIVDSSAHSYHAGSEEDRRSVCWFDHHTELTLLLFSFVVL